MSTKYRKASQLGQGADEIDELLDKLETTDHKIGGDTFEQVKNSLRKAAKAFRLGAKAAIHGSDEDVVVIEGNEPSNGGESKRAPREIPAGTFTFRPRQATYKGKTYRGATIAHLFCKIAEPIVANGSEVDEKEIAAAIQAAYPENNYRPHRVEIDLDKFQHRKFRCQRKPGQYDEAVEEAFGG